MSHHIILATKMKGKKRRYKEKTWQQVVSTVIENEKYFISSLQPQKKLWHYCSIYNIKGGNLATSFILTVWGLLLIHNHPKMLLGSSN